jgi:uncharacterized protein
MVTTSNLATLAPLTVITGGSRGIGLALAECFLGAGHHVLLVARNEETLGLARQALASRHGERVSILACDITNPEVAVLIASAAACQGRFVDVLVNNAGLWSFAPYAELPRAEIERIVDVNMLAGLRLIHAFLPGMYERRRGRILNVGSLAGRFPAAGCALYSASKSFLQTMTVALGREAAGTGVVVSLLLPGLVRTDFTQAKSKDTRSRSTVLFELVATDPAAVAEAGYLGLMSGQPVIVPGLVTRLVYVAQAMMPARLAAWLFRRGGRWLFGDDADNTIMSAVLRPPSAVSPRLALLLGLVIVLGVLLKIARAPQPKVDQIDVASIQLAARMVAAHPFELDQPSGVAPGYALLLAMLAKTSASATSGLLCMAQPSAGCRQEPFVNLVVKAQAVLEILALAMVAWIAFVVSGSTNLALVTVALAYWGGRYGDFVGVLRNFVAYHAVCHAFVAATVLAASRASTTGWLVTGVMLACMTALQPVSLLVVPVVALLIGMGAVDGGGSRGRRALGVVAFAAGGGLTLAALIEAGRSGGCAPDEWVGYVARQMAERAAFNAIDVRTWLTGVFQPIPFIGRLTGFVAPEPSMTNLGNYVPGTYLYFGLTEIQPRSTASGRDGIGQFRWLFDTYVAGDLAGYLASLPIVLWRGLWAGTGVLSLVGLYHVPRAVRWSVIDRRAGLLVVAAVPAVTIFVLNGALTSNLFVLNPLLPTFYAYAIAVVARGP